MGAGRREEEREQGGDTFTYIKNKSTYSTADSDSTGINQVVRNIMNTSEPENLTT